ncbi:hypothetical protein [Pseudoalteromonas sp. T1lg88]|uniref:hypothetical protein n=1 Tax=Pseudoalteromonas sp. T1lg88 TaxID=2077104 RepID=UPI000CF63E2B|nr:hypothetical protein [Pseudoalteromonas sp. T1lg88]
MKLNTLLLAVSIASSAFSAHAAGAASAKFAAAWNDNPVNFVSVAVIPDVIADAQVVATNDGYLITTIKVPQDKELLVGVSAEIGLTTDTSLKGKDGGAAKAIADGSAWVLLTATPVGGGDSVNAAPGAVMLSKRIQELNATLGGVLDTCTDSTGGMDENGLMPGDEGYVDTPDGTIDAALECTTTDEQIGLMQDTLASHHFNFILPNMDAGNYEIRAHFMTRASAEVDIDEVSVAEGGTISGSSYAKAFVGKHMVTVQQVRAVKGSLADVDIVDN